MPHFLARSVREKWESHSPHCFPIYKNPPQQHTTHPAIAID
jgi:hypothetical protein